MRSLRLTTCLLFCACLGIGCASDETSDERNGAPQETAAGTGAGSGGAAPPAFGNPDASTVGGGGTGAPMAQPGLDEDTCARLDVAVERVRPRIVFLVDASSSMIEDFDGPTRWDALRESLLDDDGLVPSLQDIVKFGLVTYAGPRFTTCPAFRYAAPAPRNFMLIDAAFPGAPPEESSTPTGPSMDWAIDNAFLDQVPNVDTAWEPQFMIFATDGEPNGCAQGSMDEPDRDFESVLAAAHKAKGRGIEIFVISLAEAEGEFADHLDEVAEIGGTDHVYSPTNKEALVSELRDIIGSVVSCQLDVTAGRLEPGLECKGEVWLNSQLLECNGDDGWELVDSKHILLKGEACDDYKLESDAIVSATFPCEAVD